MLGSKTDAEDAVQEAWLRLARQDTAAIENLPGWLTTVIGRICIDMLRSREARRESLYDHLVPEFEVRDDRDGGPEHEAVRAESVGLALLVILDTLRPRERLAFVLHDMFALSFDAIAEILDTSPGATKMLASRARRKVQNSRRPTQGRLPQRAAVDAFLAAARDGDFAGLLRVLDPDVTWRTYTARGVIIRRGADAVAGKALQGSHVRGTTSPVLVGGEPGVVARDLNGKTLAVMVCIVVDDRIVDMVSVTDPDRLAAFDIPD